MSITTPARGSRAGQISLACAEALLLAMLLALPLAMNVSLIRTFEASKLGAVAPLAALGLAALIAGALDGGFAAMRKPLASAPVLCFAGLLACAVLASVLSETPWVAFFGDYFRREGLISWLTYGVMFASVLLVVRSRAQVERIVDVLLLSTVAPCVYAVMQRYGYDFFLTHGLLVGTAGARPGGTMGNPVFLASLLLLIIPVTAARLLASPAAAALAGDPPFKRYLSPDRAFWLLLLGLQVYTVILSQSRGPGLGLAIALAVFVLLVGAWQRLKLTIGVALLASLAVLAGLLAINFVPALVQSVHGTPLQRFVFTGGDVTVDSRVGIWQAGVDAFTHAPWWRQWLGYGPDSASFNYFPWIPAAVQRNEGYTETIDRLHSELLEILLSFGAIGLVMYVAWFASLVRSTALRLLPGPLRALPARLAYCAWNLAGMALGAAAAFAVSGSPGLLLIGAGAGLAAAWILFLAGRAWRYLGQAGPPPAQAGGRKDAPAQAGGRKDAPAQAGGREDSSAQDGVRGALPVQAGAADDTAAAPLARDDGMLCAALASALIGSWVETLVGVPTIATLAVVAVFAALLVLATHGVWRRADAATAPDPEPDSSTAAAPSRKSRGRRAPAPRKSGLPAKPPRAAAYPIVGWATALCLMIAVADFFPPLSGARILPPSIGRLPLIGWPLALLALGGLAMAGFEARRNDADAQLALTRFLLWCVPPVLLFTCGYFVLGNSLDRVAQDDLADRMGWLVELGYGACVVMPVALAAALYLAGPARPAGARRSGWAIPALLVAGVVLGAAAFLAVWADVGADVRSKLAVWSDNQGRPDDALEFSRLSMALVPQERRYVATYAGRLVAAAGTAGQTLSSRPEAGPGVIEKLKQAEGLLAAAMARTPRDPWLTNAYANVSQFLASPSLERYLAPGQRPQYAAQARKYFALAHQQFPGQPLYLRSWVQFEIDQGNRAGAYAKLIEMEQLDPRNASAYPDWLKYARFGDQARGEAVAALRRGLGAMPPGSDEAAALLEMQIELAHDTGRPDAVIAAALEATAADPDRIRPWRQLAEAYEAAGSRDLAISNAQNAVARFAGRKLDGNNALDYAALQALVARLAPGMARPKPAPPAAGAQAAGN